MGCVDRLRSQPIAEPGPNRTPGKLNSALWLITEPGTSQHLVAAFDPKWGRVLKTTILIGFP